VCSFFIGGAIKTEWKEELASRQGDFQKLWNTLGPELMQTAETITGKSFPSANFTARLTLCDLPSQSLLGISVNMRFALAGFTETPVPMRYKADTLFHELLHEFLTANPLKDSSLLQQHATEHRRTRDHLHLLALQKAILLSLNETDALQDVIATDSQLPGGYYKRAWEIVNASDAEYLQYIAEISR
jgi:hypothetical protein